MPSIHEISKQVAAFLANCISLEQFEDWSAEYSGDIYKTADDETRDLACQIRAILNAFDDDETEDGLRVELASTIRRYCP